MHASPGYREKLAYLQGTLKLDVQFLTECQGHRDPAMKIGMEIIVCVLVV